MTPEQICAAPEAEADFHEITVLRTIVFRERVIVQAKTQEEAMAKGNADSTVYDFADDERVLCLACHAEEYVRPVKPYFSNNPCLGSWRTLDGKMV